MAKRFQKIYLEISNVCNLRCSFCPGTKRKKHSMTEAEFSTLLPKLRPNAKTAATVVPASRPTAVLASRPTALKASTIIRTSARQTILFIRAPFFQVE